MKTIDKKEAIAADETYTATALIVEKVGNEEAVRIEDKEKIKKVLDGIKIGVETKDKVNYNEGNMYNFKQQIFNLLREGDRNE